MMKLKVFFLFLFLGLLACNSKPKGISNALYTISENELNIHFSTKYKSEDLNNIQLSLDSFGFYIVYDSLRFDEGGYLKQISATIYYPDNSKSSFVSRELKDTDGPGFSYRYNHGE